MLVIQDLINVWVRGHIVETDFHTQEEKRRVQVRGKLFFTLGQIDGPCKRVLLMDLTRLHSSGA